ncbi:MAG: lysophospholipid acyltransferase family protein [Chloroflexota bacterium]
MTQNVFYATARGLIRLYARLTMKLDIQWESLLPPGPKLFVANHPSGTDPFLIHLASPHPVSVLVSAKAFAVPLFGYYIRKARQIPVNPGQGSEVLEQARQMLESGYSVAIFPEGDFSPQAGGFQRPRSGAARLALATGVPVIPVGIALQNGWRYSITSKIAGKPTIGYWYLHGPYSMTVGKPMLFNGDVNDREQVGAATERIMAQIVSLAAESERRLERKPLTGLDTALQMALKTVYTFVIGLLSSGVTNM